ncbi:MAG: tRNA 2-thiouridine(34) synthase MnmA, partial [Bacteroidales bacterium]|nr:tRNA 2-thiouridine(34) synthase MnmA [Bacteroidales bacterium]
PIGDLTKPEVRRIAREAELPSAEKKDSQGICFVGKVDLPVFLQQKLKSQEGDIVEIPRSFYEGRPEPQTLEEMATPIRYRREDGKVIGRHIGAQYYTIGQRKGLGIGGHAESCFLIANDIEKNLIFVGEGDSHPGLWRRALRIRPEEIHWIRPDLALPAGGERRYQVRIRYRQPLQAATLHAREDGLFITFDAPQRGITPGQFAVWYADDGEMVGSGVIDQ